MSDVDALFERGGWSTRQPEAGRYDPLRDPSASQELAERLAERARGMSPDLIVTWEDLEDAVLAFLVALRLELPAVRAVNADGLVEIDGRMPDGPSGVLIGTMFPTAEPVLAVATLLERMGGRLAGVVSLVGVPGASLPVPSEALRILPVDEDGP